MRIAMLGAGAIGSMLGMFLQEGGADISLVDPYKEHMEKIAADGLHLVTASGKDDRTVKMKTYLSGDECGEVDLIVILVNGMITKKVLQGAGKLIGKNTCIFTPQNGLGQETAIQEFFPDNKILMGCLGFSSIIKGPGEIFGNINRNPDKVHMYIGCLDKENGPVEMAKRVAAYARAGSLNAHYSENVWEPIWAKAANNVACNALSGIVRLTIGETYDTEAGRRIHNEVMRELCAVATAKGVPMDGEAFIKAFEEISLGGLREHYPSTAQNIFNKKPTDISFLNGAISRFGKELGIPTPYNDVITGLVTIIEKNYDKMHKLL